MHECKVDSIADLMTWQLIDSAFPCGGFAHSGGLEAAWQQNFAADSQTFGQFLPTGLRQAARWSLPVVLASARAPESFAEIDARYDALLNNHVANRASRLQGKALLAAAARTFDRPGLVEFAQTVRRRALPGHHASIFGVVISTLSLSPARGAELFAFQLLRGWIAAAVRLGVVGPLEAQAMQAGLLSHVMEAVALAEKTPVEQIAQNAPLLDMLQANHDRLYSRLFQS